MIDPMVPNRAGVPLADWVSVNRVPDTKNRAFLSAFWRGVRDAADGKHCNPYPDLRGGRYNHMVTFSRSFQKFWRSGHDAGMEVLTSAKRSRRIVER